MANGHRTPTGNISTKMGPGRTFKRWLRIEKVVRLELEQIPDLKIAEHLGVTVQSLQYMKRSPEYQAKRMELATGVIADFDSALREEGEALRAELKAMVPQALGTYKQALTVGSRPLASPVERKLALQVATDVMDREGTLAKISRTKVEHENVPVINPQIGVDLLAALQSASAARQSGDSSIHDVFVRAAGLSKDATAELHKNIKLEDFNVPTEQVQ